jgi:hypothetical protein
VRFDTFLFNSRLRPSEGSRWTARQQEDGMVREPGLYDGIPFAEYLADADGPRLSHSLAHLMLSRSPRHAWAAHPLLGNLRVDDRTEERDRGTLLHSLLLGGGFSEVVAIVDADSWRTKAAKERRAEIEEEGRIAVLAPTFEKAREVADGINESLLEIGFAGVRSDWREEVTATWHEGGVECRGRMDLLFEPRILDLKIVRSANPNAFARSMLGYGLDIQHAAYVSAVEHLIPELAGRVRMEFLLCEPFPPYAVCRVHPAGSMRSLGETKWARAVKLWGECLSSGKWPGYGAAEVEAPQWALSDDLAIAVAAAGDPDWLADGKEE